MDPSLIDLLRRLDQVSAQFHELREGVRQAVKISELAPEMSLTRARKVLESVVHRVYERRIGEPPGTRPLENLLQRLSKDGLIPRRVVAYANTVRELGNVGTHGHDGSITQADVVQSLGQLMLVLEWYFEDESPPASPTSPAAGSPSTFREDIEPTPTRPAPGVEPRGTASGPPSRPLGSPSRRGRAVALIVAAILGLGVSATIVGLVLSARARKPEAVDVAREIRRHFKEPMGMPPDAGPDSTLGEKRLIQAIFLSLPASEFDLSLVSDVLRSLQRQGYYESEGYMDVHLESVLLQLPMILEVRVLWLAEAEASLGGHQEADVDLPSFCRIDPSRAPTPWVHLSRAEISAELEASRRRLQSPPG